MKPLADNPTVALIEKYASRFGYIDGKIDLSVDDLSSFATSSAAITAHAPLYRTKEGAEKPVPLPAVRKQLSRMLKLARVARHDMHIAAHPDGDAVGIFFVVRFRIPLIPITVFTVPLVFVVHAIETDDGFRINEIDEWPAADPEAAARVLVDHHGWPAATTLEPHMAFGAAS